MTDLAPAPIAVETDLLVAMRDGVRLATDVYRPGPDTDLVAVVVRTPYGKDSVQTVLNVTALVVAGYAVVVQDCRGMFGSEGDFTPFHQEGADGSDTVSWAASQPWCDGRVVMIGPSYLGVSQWAAAIEGAPQLVAFAPATTPATFHDGCPYAAPGVLALETACMWTALQAQQLAHRHGVDAGRVSSLPSLEELTGVQLGLPDVTGAVTRATDVFAAVMAHRPRADVPDFAAVGRWYHDWLAHPDPSDEYWQRIAPAAHYGELDLPALHMTGWYDAFLTATVGNFTGMSNTAASEVARRRQRLVIGPWTHSEVGLAYSGNEVQALRAMLPDVPIPFLDDFVAPQEFEVLAWLDAIAGRGSVDTAEQPRVRIFVMGENRWRDENEWPLARTEWTRYYLHGDGRAAVGDGGTLSMSPPSADEPADMLTYDPADPVPSVGGASLNFLRPVGAQDQRAIEQRSDVAVFTTEPLRAPTEVTGPVVVDLWASSTAIDADLVARLVDVHPDGRAVGLCTGVVRASASRRGTAPAISTTPSPLHIELPPTSNLFAAGHRIRLDIAPSNYPEYEENPHAGRHSIHHDVDHPSYVTLPVIPRTER